MSGTTGTSSSERSTPVWLKRLLERIEIALQKTTEGSSRQEKLLELRTKALWWAAHIDG